MSATEKKPDQGTRILSVLNLISEMLHVLTQHFETGATFNPSDLRSKHTAIKDQLADLHEQLANGGN